MNIKYIGLLLVPAALLVQSPALVAQTQAMQNDQRRVSRDTYDLVNDMRDLNSDSADVQRDRAALRNAFANFGQAVDQHGVRSPEARAAEAQVDQAQVTLHQAIGDYRRDQYEAYRQRRDLAHDRDLYARARLQRDVQANQGYIHKDQGDIRNDEADISGDSAAIKQDRANLRAASAAYDQDVRQYGADSPQARAARTKRDQIQATLHRELGDYQWAQSNLSHEQHDLSNDQRAYHQGELTQGADHAKDAMARDRYSIQQDLRDEGADSATVRQDRAVLRNAFANYGQAVDRFGVNSGQAHAAEAQVDQAQIALHQAIGDYNRDKWNATKAGRNLAAERQALANDEHQIH